VARGSFATALIVALGLPAANADAAEARTSSLGWVRGSNAVECIGTRALAEAVEARLGRPVFVSAARADVAVEGQIERGPAGEWRAAISLAGEGGHGLGTRDLRSGGVIGLHAWLTPPLPSPSNDRRALAAIVVAAPAPIAAPTRPRIDEAAAIPAPIAARPIAAPAPIAGSSTEPTAPPAVAPTPGSGLDPASGSPSGDLGARAPVLSGETEIQLLQRAQDALGGSPARALDLLNQHAARFPGAGLGQEREVIAVDALVRLGRADEARARAAAFAASFPRSAHLRRIESLVPGKRIDSEVHNPPSAATPTGQ